MISMVSTSTQPQLSPQHPPSPLSAVVADPGAAVPCARRRPCLAVLNDPDLLGTRFNPMKVRWQGFWQYGKKKHPEGLEELEHSPTWNLHQSDLHLLLSSLATRFWAHFEVFSKPQNWQKVFHLSFVAGFPLILIHPSSPLVLFLWYKKRTGQRSRLKTKHLSSYEFHEFDPYQKKPNAQLGPNPHLRWLQMPPSPAAESVPAHSPAGLALEMRNSTHDPIGSKSTNSRATFGWLNRQKFQRLDLCFV